MKTICMKLILSIIFSLILLTVVSHDVRAAEEGLLAAWAKGEDPPTASGDIAVLSKYVWRGFELSDDSIVIQPSLTVDYRDFSFNLWGNLDTDLDNGVPGNESHFNETDMTLSYSKSMGPVSLGAGYIYYGLDAIEDSEELYFSCGLDTLLSPTLTVYREIAHLSAWYVTFDISHSFNLPKGITLDLGGSAGYLSFDDADDGSEVNDDLAATGNEYQNFHNGLISVGLTIPLTKYLSVNPMLAYSFPLTDDAHDFLENANRSAGFSNDTDYLFGGITVSIVF